MLICVLVAEVDKKSKKMRDAEKFDVPVVNEDYLDAVKKGGAKLMITQHSIVTWGSKKVCCLFIYLSCYFLNNIVKSVTAL